MKNGKQTSGFCQWVLVFSSVFQRKHIEFKYICILKKKSLKSEIIHIVL